jgi:hypothetical protein
VAERISALEWPILVRKAHTSGRGCEECARVPLRSEIGRRVPNVDGA